MPAPSETITGNERLGWDQRASDAVELSTFRYAVYVDGTRSELTAATCATASTDGAFACSARLPALSPGAHTIELASFIVDGSVFESARSSALRVTVGMAAPVGDQAPSPLTAGSAAVTDSFTVELVVEGVDRPRDLAFAPDGRLFVVEETGRIRVVHLESGVRLKPDATGNGREVRLQPDATGDRPGETDDRTLSIAIDPQFERTHFVYTLSTSRSRDDELMFTVARFREANDTLADRVVLLDDVRASVPRPAGSLRFGADGKLFVAFDDGADPALVDDLASYNGKILRLNPNGTTPDDQAGGSPLYSLAYRSPKGFDWDPATGVLWIVDAVDGDEGRISAVVAAAGLRTRGVTKTTFRLPRDSRPSSIAAYRGDRLPSLQHSLLVASLEGQHLLRIRVDPGHPTRVLGVDRLLHNRLGAVRAVTIGPDGAVYLAGDGAIHRLIP
jgi:glucose/arabinose dehydrogenase